MGNSGEERFQVKSESKQDEVVTLRWSYLWRYPCPPVTDSAVSGCALVGNAFPAAEESVEPPAVEGALQRA